MGELENGLANDLLDDSRDGGASGVALGSGGGTMREYIDVISFSGAVLCSTSQRMDRYAAQNKVDNDARHRHTGERVRVHGVDCVKVPHIGDGYLHSAKDDKPYDVDGVTHCGRCHEFLS